MPQQRSPKRAHGSGSIFEKHGAVHVKFHPVAGKRPVQRKICRVGELTDTEIERRAGRIVAEYKPPADGEKAPTVAEVGVMHINQLELDGKARSYITNRRGVLRNHVEAALGDRTVDSVKPKDLNRLKRSMQQEGKGPTVIVSAMWLLSGIFKFAIAEEWRTDNPVAAITMPEIDHDPDTVSYLTTAEVDRVIAAVLDDELGRVERPMYRTAQQTGMRRGELIALHWRECDFDYDVFRVSENYVEGEFKRTKSKKGRIVPMTALAKQSLLLWRMESRYHDDDDLVFAHPVDGEPLRPEFVSKRFKAALLRAAVGPVEMRPYKVKDRVTGERRIVMKPFPLLKLHDLRDTFGTYQMMNPRNSPREVQEWMGHASLTTTQRYAKFRPLTDAAERMGASFVDRRPTDDRGEPPDPSRKPAAPRAEPKAR
ncbi:MAG: site-specific integrase [Actinobacteria bacterium]|nr:site-specific integrase [Actinomycetota bacterium]